MVATFDSVDLTRLTRVICEFCSNKTNCGEVINIFTSHYTNAEAISVIKNLLSYEFVLDIEGSIDDLLDSIESISSTDRRTIIDSLSVDAKGKVVESDEDSNGDLK